MAKITVKKKGIEINLLALREWLYAWHIRPQDVDLGKKLKHDVNGLVEEVEKWLQDNSSGNDTCNDCESLIYDEDTFCWFCGGDVSPDKSDPGGIKNYLGQDYDDFYEEVYGKKPKKKKKGKPKKTKKPEIIDDDVQITDVGDGKVVVEEKQEETAIAVVEDETECMKQLNIIRKHNDEVLESVRLAGQSAWKVGEALAKIQDQELYLQEKYSTWSSFLAEADIGIARGTATMWVKVYRNLEYDQIGRLGLTRGRVMSGDKVTDEQRTELLESGKAYEMTSDELIKYLKGPDAKTRGEVLTKKSRFKAFDGQIFEFNEEGEVELDELTVLELYGNDEEGYKVKFNCKEE